MRKGSRSKEFRYADTDEIGIYLVRLLGGAKPVQIAYSVNVDPEESNPAKIGRDELTKRFGKTPLIFAEDPEHLDSVFKLLREGKSLWGMFLTCVLLVLIFETLVSNRLTPKKEEDEVMQVVAGVRRRPKRARREPLTEEPGETDAILADDRGRLDAAGALHRFHAGAGKAPPSSWQSSPRWLPP